MANLEKNHYNMFNPKKRDVMIIMFTDAHLYHDKVTEMSVTH